MNTEINHIVYAIESNSEETHQGVAISDEFTSVSELREEMKDRGYGRYDYEVIHSYELWLKDLHLGTGRGRTASEAKKELEIDVYASCHATIEMIKKHPERYYY